MKIMDTIKEKLESTGLYSNPVYIKYKLYIVPGVVLVIAVLISVLVTIPQFIRLFDTFKTIEDLETQKNFFDNKLTTLQGLDKQKYQEDLDTALVALPVDKDIPGVTGELLTALSASGLSLDGITFANSPTESEKVQEFQLNIDVSGNTKQLDNFIDRVKISPRIIKLSSIEVGKGKTDTLNASISFVTLYQLLPKDISAVDAPVPQISEAGKKILADIELKARAVPRVTSNQSGSGPIGKLNPFAP